MKKILSKNFSLLTFGNMTSKIGNIIYDTILAWWLIDKTGTAKYFGYITVASMLPVFILNFLNGTLIDRFNRKNILIITDLISGLVCILTGIVLINNKVNILALIVASFFLGVSSSLFNPTVKSIIPEIIPENNILKANSITTTISQIVSVIAPLLAGILINNFSIAITMVFIINGITFFLSASSEFFISYKINTKITTIKGSVKNDILDGLKYIKQNRWLLRLLYVSAIVNFFISSYNILLPLFFKKIYSDHGYYYSIALSVESLFGIIIAILVTILKNNIVNSNRIKWDLLLCGISMIGIQLFKNIYLSILAVGLFGLFLTKFNINFFALVQTKVKREKMGRVFSIIFMIASALMPLGNLIFSYIGNSMINTIYFWSGGGIILSILLIKDN